MRTDDDINMPSVKVEDAAQSQFIVENAKFVHSTELGKVRKVRRKTLFNLFVFSLCYFLVYTGFWSLSNLQSTMNAANGIGEYSQAVIYICSMVSSLLLPKFFISKFGCKNVLIVGTLICCLYMASNMYLRWDTMISASLLFGLANGPFVSAQSFYIDEMATRFQTTLKGNTEFIMCLFFGLNMFFAQNTQIWGNVIAYYVLSSGRPDPSSDNTAAHSECGIQFNPTDSDINTNLDPPSENQRLLLVGIYLGMGLLAALIFRVGLEPLKNDLHASRGCRTICNRFLSALKRLRNPQQLLLIPISIYFGMEGPFYTNEVTEAYIACSWGVQQVGFVTLCFGVCGAVMALMVGPLVKCFSQMAVLILAACLNLASYIFLFFWKPSPDFTYAYYIIASVWGMADAIWWSQVIALYGLMFPDDREAAFSNMYFWSFLGFFLTYLYANYLTVPVKIYILLCLLISGMIGYLISQLNIKRMAKREYVEIPKKE